MLSKYLKDCEIALWVHCKILEHVIAEHCYIAGNDFKHVFVMHHYKVFIFVCNGWLLISICWLHMHEMCMCACAPTESVWYCSHACIWMCNWTVCLWMPDPRVPTGRPTTTPTASRRTSRRRSRWQRGGGPVSVSWATNSPPSFCPSRR